MDDEGFFKQMMLLYDLATKIAAKEGKSHREAFNLLCQYLELEARIDQAKGKLEGIDKRIQELNEKIGERRGTLAILKAIQEGKIGHG